MMRRIRPLVALLYDLCFPPTGAPAKRLCGYAALAVPCALYFAVRPPLHPLRIAFTDNPRLNAFITVMAEEARRDAEVADGELAAGRDRGPLHGVPIAVKDLIDITGVATTAASRVREGHIASADAPVITQLRHAGAVLIGLANARFDGWTPENFAHELATAEATILQGLGEQRVAQLLKHSQLNEAALRGKRGHPTEPHFERHGALLQQHDQQEQQAHEDVQRDRDIVEHNVRLYLRRPRGGPS